jgi:periplasmic protein CpxP/Spy
MVSSFHGFPVCTLLARPAAIAVLMSVAMLASHTVSAAATEAKAEQAAESKAESVEQRIAKLHANLKITPDEEANWKGVAQAMRDNSTAMEKLVAEKAGQDPKSLTAVEDLKTYEKFARAHVDGLKNLRGSFETLYDAMPPAQQKIADQVFRSFGHEHAHGRG